MSSCRGLLAMAWLAAQGSSLKMRVDNFYSKSFLPNDLIISYGVHNMESISYNLTVKVHFPGKLLMQVFVRKLDDVPGGENTFEMLKLKNMDFCKSLEVLRNMTFDNSLYESLIPPTFIMSCPLMPGFYFLENTVLEISLLPWLIKDGRYYVLVELVQVYEEVTRLLNVKLKASKTTAESDPADKQESRMDDEAPDSSQDLDVYED